VWRVLLLHGHVCDRLPPSRADTCATASLLRPRWQFVLLLEGLLRIEEFQAEQVPTSLHL
jgi:hypothetical protein